MQKIWMYSIYYVICYVILGFSWGQDRPEEKIVLANPSAMSEGKVGWQCQGIARFPDETKLGVYLLREHPLFEILLMQRVVSVSRQRFQVELFVGQPLPPGRYRVTVFFSPQMQKKFATPTNPSSDNSPASVTGADLFTEASITTDWQMESYPAIFAENQQAVEKLLASTMELWLRMQRDYQNAWENRRWERWQAASALREKTLQQLIQSERRISYQYARPFFHSTFYHLYPLCNMLEDFHLNAVYLLQQGRELNTLPVAKNFPRQWQKAKAMFRQEVMILAPLPDIAITKEVRDWVHEIQAQVDLCLAKEQRNEQSNTNAQEVTPTNSSLPHQANGHSENSIQLQPNIDRRNVIQEENLDALILFFPAMQQAQKNLASIHGYFDLATIQWLAQVQSLYQDMLSFSEPWPGRMAYYQAMLSLVARWQNYVQQNPTYQNWTVSDSVTDSWASFQKTQEKWLNDPAYRRILLQHILAKLEKHWQQSPQPKTEALDIEIQEIFAEWNNTLLYQQQHTIALLQLSQDQKVGMFLEQYQILCLQMMAVNSADISYMNDEEKKLFQAQINAGMQKLHQLIAQQ